MTELTPMLKIPGRHPQGDSLYLTVCGPSRWRRRQNLEACLQAWLRSHRQAANGAEPYFNRGSEDAKFSQPGRLSTPGRLASAILGVRVRVAG